MRGGFAPSLTHPQGYVRIERDKRGIVVEVVRKQESYIIVIPYLRRNPEVGMRWPGFWPSG